MSSGSVPPGWQRPVPARAEFLGRPPSFAHLCGQDDAIAQIQSFIADALDPASAKPRYRTLLLSGLCGVGKTTLVRILANILLCWERKEGHEACGTCPVCMAFRADPPHGIDDYVEISAAEYAGVDAMSHLVALMRRSPLGQFKVGFADEAHRASRAGRDALLKDLEEPAPHAIYVLATTEPDKLGPALLTRCRHIRLREASTADRLRFLRRRCEIGWGLGPKTYEPATLERLGARAGKSYRELAAALDRCVTAGPLTAATVGSLFPDPLAACLRCAEALLDDDLSGAIAALVEAPERPDEKRAAMQRFLLGLSLSHARRIGPGYPSVNDLPAERLAALAARFDARRPRTSSLAAYLEDCARTWGGVAVTQDELILRVTGFFDLLNSAREEPKRVGPVADRNLPPTASPVLPRCRRRLAAHERENTRARDDGRPPYLTAGQARDLYTAASFLAQDTARLLNIRVTFDHGPDEPHAGPVASAAVTDFCRRARALLHRRGQDDFPFLSVHEVTGEGRFITELAAYVVPDHRLVDVTTWAERDFTTTRRRPAPRVQVEACRATTRAERMAYHATSLRRLLRGLDSTVYDWDERDIRRPLIDLLGVPLSQRRAIGAIDAAQRISTSDSIAPGARRTAAADGMGFLNPMQDRAWPWLFSGWELDEHRDRSAERAARHTARAHIDALYPDGPNTLVCARRAAALVDLDSRCRWPAELRPRSWGGWWPPTGEYPASGGGSLPRRPDSTEDDHDGR